MMPKDSFNEIFKNKKRVLVVMAHPDDAELYAGGTIVRLLESGKEVRVIKMTLGNRGSKQQKISERKLAQIRLAEDKKAMKILGIKPENNVYLNLKDGEVDNSLKTIEKIAYQIRQFKPDLILTHNPEDIIIRFDKDNHWINHRDHLYTGRSTIDASYPYSRDLLFFPEQLKEKGLASHAVVEFLLVDYYEHPETVYLKISQKQAAVRTKAHAAHQSQYTLEHAQEFTDFFTQHPSGKRFERFRYVICD